MFIRNVGGLLLQSKYITISSVKNNRVSHLTSVHSLPGLWKVGRFSTKKFMLYNEHYDPNNMYLDKYNKTFDKMYLENFTMFSDLFNHSNYIELQTKPGLWELVYSESKDSQFKENMFIIFNHKY